jgi:hypothetical protein
MRNMRIISVSIRDIVSNLGALLLLLVGDGFGELDELLTIYVHPCIVLATGLVACNTPCL